MSFSFWNKLSQMKIFTSHTCFPPILAYMVPKIIKFIVESLIGMILRKLKWSVHKDRKVKTFEIVWPWKEKWVILQLSYYLCKISLFSSNWATAFLKSEVYAKKMSFLGLQFKSHKPDLMEILVYSMKPVSSFSPYV